MNLVLYGNGSAGNHGCEAITRGTVALLTRQDPNDLAEKVLQVLRNKDLYDHLRRNARCPEQYLPHAVMKEIDTLLEV